MIIRKLVIEKIITRLQEVHNDSTMKNACFEGLSRRAPLPKTEKEVTEFIRVVTKLWRDSWITFPLFDAIELLKDELERSK